MTDLERALETDLVLSERQVWRHYGATLEDCERNGYAVRSVLVAPTVHRKATRPVQFVSLEPQTLEDYELRHLAAVAEVRHVLRADPRNWRVVQHAASTSPDAIWRHGLETWAIEFDAGAYSRATLLEKARSFRARYDDHIWAVASVSRAITVARYTTVQPVNIVAYL
jgi:hypothetical protein